MTAYCTLARAKTELRADTTTSDDVLMRAVFDVSARIDGIFSSRRPYFAPHVETKTFVIGEHMTDSGVNTLRLPAPLLSLTSITLNAQALSTSGDVEAYPAANYPVWELRLKDTAATWHTRVYSTSYPRPIVSITGIWGYHEAYTEAWLAVDALAAAITTTSATSLTVADVDGDDPYGFAPRISRGALLKIDDEYLEVTDTNTGTNTVTVRRGANGSTAATHLISAPVSIWQPEENVARITARQAGLLYARRGSYEASVFNEAGVTITYPQDLLTELRGALQTYVYSGL